VHRCADCMHSASNNTQPNSQFSGIRQYINYHHPTTVPLRYSPLPTHNSFYQLIPKTAVRSPFLRGPSLSSYPASCNGLEQNRAPAHFTQPPLNSTLPYSQGENSNRNKWDSKTRNMAANSNILVFTIRSESSKSYRSSQKRWQKETICYIYFNDSKETNILAARKPTNLSCLTSANWKEGGQIFMFVPCISNIKTLLLKSS